MNGVAFDIRTYALISLNVLTGNWPGCDLRDVYDYDTWKKKVERVLKKIFRERTFFSIMKCSLPVVPVADEGLRLAHDFILAMMQ